MSDQSTNGDIVTPEKPWRIALKKFDDEDKTYGDVLPKRWLYDAFGIQMPVEQTSKKVADAAELAYLGAFQAFKEELLAERSMALKTVHRVGYKIVMPDEQTEFANTNFERQMKKAFSEAQDVLFNVNHSMLTADQSRQNTDAMTHLAGLRALMSGPKRIQEEALKKLTGRTKDEG